MSDERCKANLIGISAGCDALHLFLRSRLRPLQITGLALAVGIWVVIIFRSYRVALAFDLAGSNPSNKGVAMGSVSLPAGKSYRLTGKFSFARRGTTASAIFSFSSCKW